MAFRRCRLPAGSGRPPALSVLLQSEKLVPQDDSSWEEALLEGGVRGPDLVKVRAVASSHASRWSQVRLYWYVDSVVYDPVHHAESNKISALLKGVPAKICHHLCDTAFLAVVICNKIVSEYDQ